MNDSVLNWLVKVLLEEVFAFSGHRSECELVGGVVSGRFNLLADPPLRLVFICVTLESAVLRGIEELVQMGLVKSHVLTVAQLLNRMLIRRVIALTAQTAAQKPLRIYDTLLEHLILQPLFGAFSVQALGRKISRLKLWIPRLLLNSEAAARSFVHVFILRSSGCSHFIKRVVSYRVLGGPRNFSVDPVVRSQQGSLALDLKSAVLVVLAQFRALLGRMQDLLRAFGCLEPSLLL